MGEAMGDAMKELNSKGFIVLKDVLKKSDIEKAHSYIQEQQMDYASMTTFIENTMLKKINHSLDVDITYTKYRVSNNNNSVDAGGFHRDIVPLHTNAPPVPVYTCLCYLDKTVMELIPGTHNTLEMSYIDAFSTFNSSITIPLNPTDLLIFNSALIHRGIFTENLGQRRLIQVFNCFINKHDFMQYSPRLLDIEGDNKLSEIFLMLYKSSLTSFLPNLFGYLNTATGGGTPSLPTCTELNLDSYWYGSSEGLCSRVKVVPNTLQKTNLYYIAIENAKLPTSCAAEYKYLKYTRQFILYLVVLLCSIVACVTLLVIGAPYILTHVSRSIKPVRRVLR